MTGCNQRLGVTRMLKDQTTVGAGEYFVPPGLTKNLQVTIDGTGALATQIVFEGTNNLDPRDWIILNTINLSGNDHVMGGDLNADAWAYVRCRVVTISGTGAKINAYLVAL